MDEFAPKREWPDGEERVLDGTVVVYSNKGHGPCMLHANEIPSDIRKMMQADPPVDMLELSHHADPAVKVYVRSGEIIALDARWTKVSE